MRISFKTIALLWVGLLMLIGGLLFNAYSKLKPETFIALLSEQVQKNYPGAKLEVGKIDYQFSLDFNLNLQGIQLRRSGKLLASIGKVELKVPWWILIINRGNAQINLSHLDIYIDHNENHDLKISDKSVAVPLIKVNLPNYLADARFTLRAKEVSIRDIHNERRFFTLSKLLVREFHYGKNSAFELNIPIEIKHNQARYSSDLWLFGDVTPEEDQWKLNFRGEFRAKDNNEKFQIEDLVIAGKANFRPQSLDVNSDIELQLDKNVIGKGTLKANQNDLNVNFDFNQIPVDYFGIIYEEIKNPYLNKLEGLANGNLNFKKSFDGDASIEGKLGFDGNFQVSSQFVLTGKWQLSFINSRWEISFISPKAEASFFRRSVIDMKKGKVTQFTEELGFMGLDLKQVIPPVRTLPAFMLETSVPYYHTAISYKKCLLAEKEVSGTFRYGKTPDQKFYQGNLTSEGSEFKIDYQRQVDNKKINISMIDFNWIPEYQFLSPIFTANEGLMNGKIEGRWNSGWEEGQWLFDIKSSHLTGPQGIMPMLLQKTLANFEIDRSSFKKESLNLSVRNNIIKISSYLFTNNESGKITGSLSTSPKKKSFLVLSYPKNKKWRPVKKDIIETYWIEKDTP